MPFDHFHSDEHQLKLMSEYYSPGCPCGYDTLYHYIASVNPEAFDLIPYPIFDLHEQEENLRNICAELGANWQPVLVQAPSVFVGQNIRFVEAFPVHVLNWAVVIV